MSAEIWAAIIGAGAAVVGVLVGQYWSANTTLAQLRHAEQQEDLKWRREEVRRLADLRDQRLRELWAHVLEVRVRAIDLLTSGVSGPDVAPKAKDGVFEAAARAYAVALTGLPELRENAKEFYLASANLEASLTGGNEDAKTELTRVWTQQFFELEAAVARAAELQFSALEVEAQTSP